MGRHDCSKILSQNTPMPFGLPQRYINIAIRSNYLVLYDKNRDGPLKHHRQLHTTSILPQYHPN